MYNLIVTGAEGAWDHPQFDCERSRFLEYTADAIRERYSNLTDTALRQLCKIPTLFAYEGRSASVRLGFLRNIKQRTGSIQIEYDFDATFGSRPISELSPVFDKLDIGKVELYRTHWAIKDEEFIEILVEANILAGHMAAAMSPQTSLEETHFKVALSFPGEQRQFVEAIANHLRGALGKGSVFYDRDYTAQLARPNLDMLLQRIYLQADLVVVFLCLEYESKQWCGLEWRAVRQIIKDRRDHAIMLMRFDSANIPGLFSIDGYVDLRQCTAEQAANYIAERARQNPVRT